MKTFFSPAKLNLFLKVLGKREDGFHNLASLFQAVSLGDYIHLELADQDGFQVTGISREGVPVDDSNFAWKALDLFRKALGRPFHVKMVIEKQIPLQAGLGGGNSNAATVLWALNELHHFPLKLEQLIDLSKQIGSDTTFFLSQGTAYCTGRGENIENLPSLNFSDSLFIVKPNFGLSTKDVFQALDGKTYDPNALFHSKEICQKFLSGSYHFFNDLESPAFSLKPTLLKLKEDLLKRGFSHVVMTGSGTSLVAIGHGILPKDASLKIFPVTFVRRNEHTWYNHV